MRATRFIAGIAVVALAGCGGGGSSSTQATAKGPDPAALCARIPAAAVQRFVAKADPSRVPRLRRSATGTKLLLQCTYAAQGVKVQVNLDRANNNRQRFDNRITEMSQFSTYRPSTLPHPVRGVGDAAEGDEGAQWIPAFDQLLAYMPGQYLIVNFTAGNAAGGANRAGSADLARLAFRKLPRGYGINRRGPTPTG